MRLHNAGPVEGKPTEKRTGRGEALKKISPRLAHTLMAFTVVSWGLDYSLAKNAMEAMDSLTLIFIKYLIAWVILIGVKLRLEGPGFMKKKAAIRTTTPSSANRMRSNRLVLGG